VFLDFRRERRKRQFFPWFGYAAILRVDGDETSGIKNFVVKHSRKRNSEQFNERTVRRRYISRIVQVCWEVTVSGHL
jgi:hypothetical protein